MRDNNDTGKPSRDVVHTVIWVLWAKYNSAIEIHRQFTHV
jgi:hypothetical protein